MGKSTTRLPYPWPVQTFFKCLDDSARPREYAGDWPVAGRVYAGELWQHRHQAAPQVYLDGFWSNEPGGGLPVERFIQVTRVWLN